MHRSYGTGPHDETLNTRLCASIIMPPKHTDATRAPLFAYALGPFVSPSLLPKPLFFPRIPNRLKRSSLDRPFVFNRPSIDGQLRLTGIDNLVALCVSW